MKDVDEKGVIKLDPKMKMFPLGDNNKSVIVGPQKVYIGETIGYAMAYQRAELSTHQMDALITLLIIVSLPNSKAQNMCSNSPIEFRNGTNLFSSRSSTKG